MPGVQSSMPLKHDPTVDLITAKPNKQKSISAGKVKEEGGKKREEIRSQQLEVVVVVVAGVGAGAWLKWGSTYAINVCSLPK